MNIKRWINIFRAHPIYLILLISLFLRIPYLNGSFWLDEAAQALESSRPFNQQFDIAPDFQPPLLHLIVHALVQISRQQWWLRLTALFAGIVMIWGTYSIGKRLWNRRVGIFSALLLSVNSFHIFYSQELRPYALAGMFAVLGWEILTRFRNEKKSTKVNFLLIVYTSVLIGGLFSTYLFPFVFVTLFFTSIFIYPKMRLKFFLTHIFAGLAFLPWLPSFLRQLQVGSALRQATQGWDQVVSLEQWKALPLTYGKLFFGVIELEVNWMFVMISIFFGLWFLLLFYQYFAKGYLKKDFRSHIIVCAWLFVPTLLAWIISFWVPVIRPKRLLFIQPALFLFLTAVAEAHLYKHELLRHLAVLFFMTILSMQIFSTYIYFTNPHYQRENWRELIQVIDQDFSAANTAILFKFDHPFSPWDWYGHQNFTTISTGTGTKINLQQIDLPMQASVNFDTILVFDYLGDLTDPNRLAEQWLENNGFTHSTIIDAGNIGFVRSYRKL